jgi:hypothetical protein
MHEGELMDIVARPHGTNFFVLANRDTGAVKLWYSGADVEVQDEVEGYVWIETPEPYRPAEHLGVDFETGEFTPRPPPPPPSLDEQKTAAKQTVSASRNQVVDSGMIFNGVRFQTRPDDRENIAGAAQWASIAIANGAQPADLRWHGGSEDFTWIVEDNSLLPMDAQTVVAFALTVAAFKSAAIRNARRLKDEIDSAVDETALQEIDTAAGWPGEPPGE